MGRHLLLEIYDIDFDVLNDLESLVSITHSAIERAKMTILNTYTHQFSPQGLTILISLAESHVSLHTFPEHHCVSIDAYTCGNNNPKLIAIELLKYFDSYEYQIREITR